MTTTPVPAVINRSHAPHRPSQAHFLYSLYTVARRIPLVGETTVWAISAQAAVDNAIAMGYAKAEAAPAVPVNGYPEGLPVIHGDTAQARVTA